MARGRPTRGDTRANGRIFLRVTAGQRLELRRVAAENHTNVSGVIREAVEAYVADYDERQVFGRPRVSRR